MVFVCKIKSRSSDIIYPKLLIQLCKTRQSLDDLYFFILTKKTNFFLQLNCRYSKANKYSQVVQWPAQDYRIHVFQVAQGTGFDILIKNYL